MRVSKRWKILSAELERSWARLSKDLEPEKRKKKEKEENLRCYVLMQNVYKLNGL